MELFSYEAYLRTAFTLGNAILKQTFLFFWLAFPGAFKIVEKFKHI